MNLRYLKIWLEDDEELEKIGTEYAAGRMLTGEVKRLVSHHLARVMRIGFVYTYMHP